VEERKEISRKPGASAAAKAARTPAKPRRVGLRPEKGWHKRNFLTQVLIPSLFTKRLGTHLDALFPDLADGQVGITWIGHASFLLQTQGVNILVDPNWAKWLKVIKRIKHPGISRRSISSSSRMLISITWIARHCAASRRISRSSSRSR
jgi:hypothetical protein